MINLGQQEVFYAILCFSCFFVYTIYSLIIEKRRAKMFQKSCALCMGIAQALVAQNGRDKSVIYDSARLVNALLEDLDWAKSNGRINKLEEQTLRLKLLSAREKLSSLLEENQKKLENTIHAAQEIEDHANGHEDVS